MIRYNLNRDFGGAVPHGYAGTEFNQELFDSMFPAQTETVK
jgi:hypothetical protein